MASRDLRTTLKLTEEEFIDEFPPEQNDKLIKFLCQWLEENKSLISKEELRNLLLKIEMCHIRGLELCARMKDAKGFKLHLNLLELVNVIFNTWTPYSIELLLAVSLNKPQWPKEPKDLPHPQKQAPISIFYNGFKLLSYEVRHRIDLHSGSQFTDSDGFLKLSDSINERLMNWKRASEIFKIENCCLNFDFKPCDIAQTQVPDCSVLSSLIVLRNYERQHKAKVLRHMIFPNFYNPLGKYLVKLYLNGGYRTVWIDDFLPASSSGKLLSSATIQPGDILVTLLEKAYLKVHGGYDFDGSTSSTDIWRFSKWIPEWIPIEKKSPEEREKLWIKIKEIFHSGFGVVCAGSGEGEKSKSGIQGGHSYAILDAHETSYNKKRTRVLIMQNPWRKSPVNKLYAFKDIWDLPQELKDILMRMKEYEERGTFMIEYEQFCEYFEDLHINWNPKKLFTIFKEFHESQILLPNNQIRPSIKENQQYMLTFGYDPKSEGQIIWILLSKHDQMGDKSSKKFLEARVFLVLKQEDNALHSKKPSETLELPSYNKQSFNLTKIYPKDLWDKHKSESFELKIVLGYFDLTPEASEYSLLSFSLYIYSTVPYEIKLLPR